MTIPVEVWKQFLDRIVTLPNVSDAARHCGITIQSYFNALRQSGLPQYAERLQFEWQGEVRWIHEHYAEARKQNIVLLEAHLRDLLQRDEEIVLDGAGRIVYELNPDWIGETDEVMIDFGLNPVRDRLKFDRATGLPIPLKIKKLAIPAHLLIRGASALLPRMWGERSEVNVNIGGGMMVVGAKNKQAPPLQQIEGHVMNKTEQIADLETRLAALKGTADGYVAGDPPEKPEIEKNHALYKGPVPNRPAPDIWREPDKRHGIRTA